MENAESVTLEAWVKMDSDCPEGARIIDKWAMASQGGCRLEVGANGGLRFITTAPDPTDYSFPLPTNKFSHVVAVFSPRGLQASIYLDGKLVASNPSDSGRWPVTRTSIPVQVGADQDGGNRFIGSISQVAVFDRALTADEVAQRFQERSAVSGQVGEWQLTETAGDIIKPTAGDDNLEVPIKITPSSAAAPGGLTLWYQQPAREWVEALPVGNG